MADSIKVLTGPPVPAIGPQTPVTLSVQSYLDRYLSTYVPKVDFSTSSTTTQCYVLDGGDSTEQPCDDE